MRQKITLSTVFAALLWAQCVAAVPPRAQSTADSSSVKESQQPIAVTARPGTEKTSSGSAASGDVPLRELVMSDFHKVIDFALQSEKALAKRVLDDAVLAAENSYNMQTMRRNLTKFIKDVNDINEDEEDIDPAIKRDMTPVFISVKCKALTVFLQLVQQHNTTILAQPTREDFLIENAFKRHGWAQCRTALKEHFHKFIETTEGRLKEHQKLGDKNLAEWAVRFLNVDKEKKFQLLFSFIILNRNFPLY